MRPEEISIATITWARDPAEEELLCRSLNRLAAHGLPVVVADRPTRPEFSSYLRHLPGFRVVDCSTPGLVPQVLMSLKQSIAFGRPFVLYVEPDKEEFFETGLHDFIARAPAASETLGVVVAARSETALNTFPSVQRFTEGVINAVCGEMLGRAGDYSYGPFVMNPRLVEDVAQAGDGLGWGWRFLAFASAHRSGLEIHHVGGEYACPVDQRSETPADRRHRLKQLSENLLGLLSERAGGTRDLVVAEPRLPNPRLGLGAERSNGE